MWVCCNSCYTLNQYNAIDCHHCDTLLHFKKLEVHAEISPDQVGPTGIYVEHNPSKKIIIQ